MRYPLWVIGDRIEPAVSPAMCSIALKAEVNSGRWRHCGGLLRVDGAARDVIQTPKPEPRIMRCELSNNEWTAIKPILPNKPRGVRRVNARRVLNGIFWVLRSGAQWRGLPENCGPRSTLVSLT